MSAKSKIKGYRNEVLIRDKLNKVGIPCERVPLSGLLGGKYDGDLAIPAVHGVEFVCEVKARAGGTGFTVIEKWMKDKPIMFIRRDHQEAMVVLKWDTFVQLMSNYLDKTKTKDINP